MSDTDSEGVFKVPVATRLLGSAHRVLEGAVPPVSQTSRAGRDDAAEPREFGWISDAFPTPPAGGFYVVRFTDRAHVRILAYVDRAGRAFDVTGPIASVPAEKPVLDFARYADSESGSENGQRGCVEVRNDAGRMLRVADYRCVGGRFSFMGSWFDFGANGTDLSYEDALSRAYLAFAYRPKHGGAAPFACGFDLVTTSLARLPLARALEKIQSDVRRAEHDRALSVPVPVRLLSRWLDEADAQRALELPEEALRLVRTARYADLYYVSVAGEGDWPWVERFGWAIEGALNRFKLLCDALGESAFSAGLDECARVDAGLAGAMVRNAKPAADPEALALAEDGANAAPEDKASDCACAVAAGADLPERDEALGEWDARRRIAGGLESLLAPARALAEFRVDLARGAAAFYVQTPDAALMPRGRWDAAAHMWRNRQPLELADEAVDFSLATCAALVKIAFGASERIERVEVAGAYLPDSTEREAAEESGAFLKARSLSKACRAAFERADFQSALSAWEAAGCDARALRAVFESAGGSWSRPGEPDAAPDAAADPREVLNSAVDRARVEARRGIPESADGLVPEPLRARLGAVYLRDMRITEGSAHRSVAEELASQLEQTERDRAAIDAARACQRRAGSPFDVEAANRVMRAITMGTVARGDKNAVVECFMGDDAYYAALKKARGLAEQGDESAAADLLLQTIEGAQAAGRFADTAETVYRAFDSYASRLAYNLARTGTLAFDGMRGRFDFAERDAGKRVEIAPDSLYLDCLEAEGLLSRSFEGSDEAVRLGERAIRMAPTVALGYRQLARACMLTGDLESSRTALSAGLQVAMRRDDVAISYYQLGYVLWEMELPQAGALCYLKSASVAPLAAPQAMQELRELVRQRSDVQIVPRDKLDEALADQGVAVAPNDELLDAVLAGAAAATDADMFLCARSLLETRLDYRPDDALVDLTRSLEDPLI